MTRRVVHEPSLGEKGKRDAATETFTYNNDGQVLTDQNPLGATTQYIYDSFGRLTEEILPDSDGSGPAARPRSGNTR